MRNQTTARVAKKVTTALLALAMALGVVFTIAPVALADADPFVKSAEYTSLGTSGIGNPTEPSAATDPWTGSYVWYAKYAPNAETEAQPMKYRVLAPSTNDFGDTTTMLLDCDTILTPKRFDASSNVWATSELRTWLNGDEFLSNPSVFTTQECAAIAASTKTQDDGAGWQYLTYVALNDDKVFLLDAKEVMRESYGYSNTKDSVENRKKTGKGDGNWWLRSFYSNNAGRVAPNGALGNAGVVLYDGVSPAFNVNLSSIVFSSEITSNEYKLTLVDVDVEGNALLTIVPDRATVSGTTVTVPYSIEGSDKRDTTQASYVILAKKWGEAENEILAYDKLGLASEEEGTFTLPESLSTDGWGTDYFVYALAENVNGMYESDYASELVEVELVITHSVTLTGGANATVSGGATTQAELEGAMTAVTYTAKSGYHFEAFADITSNGVTAARTSDTVVTVYGTPTADVELKVPDAVADAKPEPDPEPAGKPTVAYSGHVQTYGDKAEVKDGNTLGTTTEGKRLEALKVTVSEGSISYRAHVQGIGWQEWKKDGAEAGTRAQAKRMEAVQIQLDGALANDYSVWYRVHSQTFGWLGWAKDGDPAGTTGLAKRAEAIEVVIKPKGETPEKEYVATKAAYVGGTICDAHIQTTGWTGRQMGLSFGTTGRAKRLEAIKLTLAGEPYSGGVEYDVHCQTTGWQATKADGDLAGTTGKAKRLEAVRIRLTGKDATDHLSVWYRVHSQTYGWLGWAKDGNPAGTTGLAKRAEAIEVQVLPKGALPDGYDASVAACRTK